MVITKTQKFWLESDFVLELLKQVEVTPMSRPVA
jgi:hypothetical protein